MSKLGDYQRQAPAIRVPLGELPPAIIVPGQANQKRRLLKWEHAPDPFVIAPLEWLIGGLWCKDTHGELVGPEKSLKSYIGMIIDVGVAAGVPVFDQFPVTTPGRILHLAGEGGRLGYWRRFGRVCEAYGVSVDKVRPSLKATFNAAPIGHELLEELVNEVGRHSPDLVRLDPWYAYAPSQVDTRQLAQVGASLAELGEACALWGASLLINNHWNQTGGGQGLQRITGAGHAEWCDSWLIVYHREPADVAGGRFRLRLDAGSRQWGGTSWDLNLDIGRFDVSTGQHDGKITWHISPASVVSGTDPLDAKVVTAKVALLKAAGAKRPGIFTKTELVAVTLGSPEKVLRVAFDQLVEQGLIRLAGMITVPFGKATRQVPGYEATHGNPVP